jgi:hypothetical protein
MGNICTSMPSRYDFNSKNRMEAFNKIFPWHYDPADKSGKAGDPARYEGDAAGYCSSSLFNCHDNGVCGWTSGTW